MRVYPGAVSLPTSVGARTPSRAPAFGALLCGLLTIALSLGACVSNKSSDVGASKPKAKTGEPLRVRLVDYVSGQKLELLNESHTDRSELYSKTKKLADAGAKVTTDEVMDETLKLFREQGYFERAVPGSAPPTSVGGVSKALEVEEKGKVTHWTTPKAANDDYKRFQECTRAFVLIYTNTYGLQSVDQAPDWEKPAPQKPVKKGS